MKLTTKKYDDFILSSYPRQVTVGELRKLLARKDRHAKTKIIDFINHRLSHRYVTPLIHVPRQYKSGFLMMASACLMIETMQAFYEGKKETEWGTSVNTFRTFFQRQNKLFPGLAVAAKDFYKNIRCGILHQAETRAGYRILRIGPLFDAKEKVINADAFLRLLAKALAAYIAELRESADDSDVWRNAKKKVRFVSDNCQT
jgi:hypothetical protein